MASSSSSSSSPLPMYDVFLSFRGKDTRENFTSHLYAGLCREKINTFIDDEALKMGDEISPALYKAIEDSMIYIIIFSENYASSTWCLNELTKILECKEKYKRDVMPIFYKVDPSTVRHQRQSYAEAFVKHELRFKDDKETVQKWKDALKEATNISGWDSNNIRPESMLVDGIVKSILRRLDRSSSSDLAPGMVGIDEHIAQIQSMLQLKSVTADVRIIGIWGMGGIGKTTLARALHTKLATQFSSRNLVENAQQEIDRDGTYNVREKYLSKLGLSDGRLKRANVLLILDDVNKSSQIRELIGGRGTFGPGSRIIVTSRDRQVLMNIADDDGIYQVKEMNHQDSQKLFNLNAFEQICPKEGYKELVEKFLEYAKGVPLALQVLGALLNGKPENVWKSLLEKLERSPEVQIFTVLKLSYDGLDEVEKNIFLDIACFYVGHFVDVAVEMLDSCGFSAVIGMDVLKDRCLISFTEGRIGVHDLIREMGTEIVRQECAKYPGKRTRLWKHEEIHHVLRDNQGTDAIQCISLDMCRIKKVQLKPNFFESMPNLRMLYFHKHFSSEEGQSNLITPSFLGSLPNGLNVLHWDEFPQRSLPLGFCPENLVKLHMRHSRLQQLWKNDQELPNLKRLNFSNSWNLIQLPDLSTCPNIEEIILCSCEALTRLPIDLCRLKFLRKLDLNRCLNLEQFPEINETMENLAVLVLDQTAIQELPSCLDNLGGLEELSLEFCSKLEIIPSSIDRLTKLSKLELMGCESLETFPSNIFKLKLKKLNLSCCSKLKAFPEILGPAESFAHIDLSLTEVKELPSSLDLLVGLQSLCLKWCRDLESLPNSISNLTLLSELDCSGCVKLTGIPEDIGGLSSLRKLSLRDTRIVYLPESIVSLSCLESLDVSECRKLEYIPQLPPFMKQLFAFGCPSIRRMMSNSRFKLPKDSEEESTLGLYFTSNEEQDPSAHSDVVADARLRISEDACRFVFYCFPGSTVPDWLPFRSKGNSVTVEKDSLNLRNDDGLTGFALCFVLRLEDMNNTRYSLSNFRCRLTFESDGHTHTLPNADQLNNHFFEVECEMDHVKQDHTFLWKYYLIDCASNDKGIFYAQKFTFEISDFQSISMVKECGICPLYTKEKDEEAEPTVFEESAGQALFDLENTYQELKSDLKDT